MTLPQRTPAAVPKENAMRPSTMMNRVRLFRKVFAEVVQPTDRARKMVMMFISSLPAVFWIRSTTPHSFIRLPSISIPTRTAASGTMRETMMVTMMGKMILSVLVTVRSCFITTVRSFLEVRAFMMGGWMTGTRAM